MSSLCLDNRVTDIIKKKCLGPPMLQVHYKGTLDDGTVFDCSHEREPLGFIVGGGKVIRGFDDAVIGLAKGERRKERVPPENAYGACYSTQYYIVRPHVTVILWPVGNMHPATTAYRRSSCPLHVHHRIWAS